MYVSIVVAIVKQIKIIIIIIVAVKNEIVSVKGIVH
jgi:hypothetical protein